MRMLIMLAPVIALAAAGCSRAPENGQGAAIALQPGLWETVDVFTTADVTGLPEAVAAQVRGQLNRPETNRNCLTPQMAADPARNVREGIIGGGAPGGASRQCRFSENIYANGVVRLRADCGPVRLTMDGTFTATTTNIRVETSAQSPPIAGGSPGRFRLSGTSIGRRVGDCPRQQ